MSATPRLFKARSLRGLLEVMPSRDLRFTGFTFGWVGIGFIRTVPKSSARGHDTP